MTWLREPNAEPIPGYKLIEPIGSGGFGEVWKCEAPGGLFKAIKFVYGNLNSLDVEGVRAEQELHALQRVKEVRHPFICSLDRIEIVDGELVIVMELAERTLHDLFIECQAAGMIGIPRDDLLRYLRDAAEALDYMNEKHNLQHLDVKPRNLFLIGDRVKVADFGLVKHLERQSASGLLGGVTPLYASPETFNGKISQTSDQYSLAVVYQEMLTGQRPFVGKNVRQLAQQHLQGDPDLRAMPEAERPILTRALAKDPTNRFANCMAFLAALYRARAPVRIEAVPAASNGAVAKAGKPKTMAETMEDVALEARQVSAVPDIAAPPVAIGGESAGGDSDEEAAVNLGLTIPQPESGALRPTLIIGVGGFGRKALLELRCRFLDRFGDLKKLPLVRFLCVDPDPEAVNVAVRGAPDVALSRNEVYHLPLQPVGNYRRRSIDQLTEWLPREKLYGMPRSLQPQGSRALGRLAFADSQQRLLGRLRREIQEITNPDILYQSVTQTGLALRDNTPRIYVIAAAGGGSSGVLADLGYALRRQLANLRHPDAPVVSLLFCGAPGDPATPKLELANVYATLTELNHYSDPSIPFAAEYGIDGQRIIDQGAPYSSVYVLPQANRSPDSLEEILAHMGSYLFHELTTPLGLRLDHLRHGGADADPVPGATIAPLRSFGTYAVWFPRGLLLRLAARHTCRKLIDTWLVPGEPELSAEALAAVNAFAQDVATEPTLQVDALLKRVEEASQAAAPTDLGARPAQALTGLLANLEEQSIQSVAQEDPVNWSKQALNRVLEWVGSGSEGESDIHEWRKTRLSRALLATAQKIAEEWDHQLSKQLFGLMEHAGARVAAAEAALTRLQKFCQTAADGMNERLHHQIQSSLQAWRQLETALQGCTTNTGSGGFRWFSGRSRSRGLRGFMDALSHFARQRLSEELLCAVRHFYAAVKGRMADRGRDLGFCRQRLRHLQESLEFSAVDADEDLVNTVGPEYTLSHSPVPSTETYWEAIRQSATARVVLPDNEQDLERAALRFLQGLRPEQWLELDKEVHERVLGPRGGLHGACVNSGDLTRMLTVPLMEETAAILGQHLPIMDVAQILSAEFGIPDNALAAPPPELKEQTAQYLEKATPLISGKNQARHHTFLLVPASQAGKVFGEMIHHALPDVKVVRVPGQSDLMFCREQGSLGVEDLPKLIRPCRAAYEALAGAPATSPHARFDVVDWLPLDP